MTASAPKMTALARFHFVSASTTRAMPSRVGDDLHRPQRLVVLLEDIQELLDREVHDPPDVAFPPSSRRLRRAWLPTRRSGGQSSPCPTGQGSAATLHRAKLSEHLDEGHEFPATALTGIPTATSLQYDNYFRLIGTSTVHAAPHQRPQPPRCRCCGTRRPISASSRPPRARLSGSRTRA